MEMLCSSIKSFAKTYIEDIKSSLDTLDLDSIERIVDVLWTAYSNDKQVFIMGNGGSASTSSHFACDLSKGTVVKGRKRLRVICLNDNTALITALSNDLNYDDVFKEQLKNLVNPDDVVIVMTASGNSPSVLKAVECARENDATTLGFIGFDGGKLYPLVDESIVIKNTNYGYIEDIHLVLVHMISQSLKHRLTSEN